MQLTDSQELALVIVLVLSMMLTSLACLCKLQRCSERDHSVPFTPGAACRYLVLQCGPWRATPPHEEDRPPSPVPSAVAQELVKQLPPPYAELPPPPLYEELQLRVDPRGEPEVSAGDVAPSLWEPPPPYVQANTSDVRIEVHGHAEARQASTE